MNSGSMDPREPNTLPKRTEAYRLPVSWAIQAVSFSATRLECPSAVVGLAALSVETLTNTPTSAFRAASSTLRVPSTLVFHASSG